MPSFAASIARAVLPLLPMLVLAAACQPTPPSSPAGVPPGGGAVADLPLPGGATQRVLYLDPDGPPAATLVLLPGGGGVLRIADDGRIERDGNFLIRTRDLWRRQGFAIVIPDVPSDRNDLLGFRLTDAYGETLRRIVASARERHPAAPVWLVGTSQGTNAAVNAGSRLAAGGEIAGLVLTSSVTRQGNNRLGRTDTVFGARLDRVTVPVLIVAHRDDHCVITPPNDAARLRGALTGSPRTELMIVDGGLPPRSDPCEAFSEHGFYGIEPAVVGRIAAWIRGNGATAP